MDHRSVTTGAATKTGDGFRGLDCGNQTVVTRSEPRHRGSGGIVEYIAGGAALVGAVPVETAGVTQPTDDFIDQDLRCYPQGNIGIAVLLY